MDIIRRVTDNPVIGILTFLGIYVVYVLLWRFLAIYKHVRLLKSFNLPGLFYVIYPIEERTIFSTFIRSLSIWKVPIKLLNTIGLAEWDKYYRSDWRWHKRNELGKRGGVMYFVSPERIMVEICDADTICYLTGKEGRVRFEKPKWQYVMLDIYSDNIVTCNKSEWPRHRRVAAPAFNERSYGLAWKISIEQALGMKWDWTHWGTSSTMESPPLPTGLPSATPRGLELPIIHTPGQDMRKLSLHVISGAAFGVDLPYSETAPNPKVQAGSIDPQEIELKRILNHKQPTSGYHMTYLSSIGYIADYSMELLLSTNLWPFWKFSRGGDGDLLEKRPRFLDYLPERVRPKALYAWMDFGKYLRVLIDREREFIETRGGRSNDNLLSCLVQSNIALELASEHEDKDVKAASRNGSTIHTQKKTVGLNREETVGNAYIFSFAGHDTITGTLEYSLILLALHPEMQEWVLEILDKELEGQSEDPMEWDYAELYPKLIVLKCLMYEILRMFPPVNFMPKWIDPATTSTPQLLMVPSGKPDLAEATSDLKPIYLPPGTLFDINAIGLHYNPRYFGPDAHIFRPSRWYRPQNQGKPETEFLARFAHDASTNSELKDSLYSETGIYTPKKGSFVPFSYGHRACLGKKFAIVEYCAAIAVVLKDYRVELADHTLIGKRKHGKLVKPIPRGKNGKKVGLTKEEIIAHAWKRIDSTQGALTLKVSEGVALRLVKRK